MGTGALGYLAIARQNSLSTATTSYHYVPILSESLVPTIEPIILEGMRGRISENETVEGLETNEGDISMEVHPIEIGHFLRGVTNAHTVSLVTSQYVHKFLPSETNRDLETALPPYTLQIDKDVAKSYQFTGCVFPSLEFTIDAGGVLNANVGVLSQTSSLMTPTGPSHKAGTPWAWSVLSASLGGGGFGQFESLSVAIDNIVEGVPLMNTTKRVAEFQRTGFRTVRISGTVNFNTNSEWQRFKAQTQSRLTLNFGLMTTSGPTMVIDVPKFRYASFDNALDGPGRLSADFEGHAKLDPTSNYAIEITLTNTEASYSLT